MIQGSLCGPWTVAAKIAGQVPHSKISSQELSLYPDFYPDRIYGLSCGSDQSTIRSRQALDRLVAWRLGRCNRVCNSRIRCGFQVASVATSAVFARIAIPEMLKVGYDKRFAAGVVVSAGTLASLIPPSAILVILRYYRETRRRCLVTGRLYPRSILSVNLWWTSRGPSTDD